MTADWQETAFETRAIHVGQEPDPTTGAITTPIYQTSTFVQRGVGEHGAYEYGRTHNPTRTALQEVVASLEGAAWGLAYASGLAGTQNISYLLAPGDHIVLSDDAYGGTHRFVAKVISRYGIAYDVVDMSDLDQIRAAIRPETKLIWAESPTNPYLKIVDIAGVAELIRGHQALLAVDNTFASPYLQNPLALGADLVLHSSTKYLGGHADVVGGVVVGNDPDIFKIRWRSGPISCSIPAPSTWAGTPTSSVAWWSATIPISTRC
jgi:cystathionine gamma-synthase